MMQSEDRAVRSRRRQCVSEEAQRLACQRSEFLTRNHRIQQQDPKAATPMNLVDRLRGRGHVEQVTAELGTDIVVAREVCDICSGGSRRTVHHLRQILVAGRIASIGKVTGQDEQIGLEVGSADRRQTGEEIVAGTHSRQQRSFRREVDIRYLDEKVLSQSQVFRWISDHQAAGGGDARA